MTFGLLKDHLNVLGLSFFQLLLKVTTSMLILAKSKDLSMKTFKRDVCKPRDFYPALVM